MRQVWLMKARLQNKPSLMSVGPTLVFMFTMRNSSRCWKPNKLSRKSTMLGNRNRRALLTTNKTVS